jgi:hypothetical protein
VIFNLATLHLGDVLMAMPAMRAGDSVVARPQHRVPGLPVDWLDSGNGLHAQHRPDQHVTGAWLELADREPVRHRLLPEVDRTLTVIAPDVAAPEKQWDKWEALQMELELPHAVRVGASLGREAWMALLNRAHTVICPDTGTAHMADALAVPKVIVLHGMGETHFNTYAPFWNRDHCIVRDSMGDISVNHVMEALRG